MGRWVHCSACHGTGYMTCSRCGGRGYVRYGGKESTCGQCNGKGFKTCPSCYGKGYKTCIYCHGRGEKYIWKAYKVIKPLVFSKAKGYFLDVFY